MNKRQFFNLVLVVTLPSFYFAFDVPPELKDICPNGCKAYFNCDAVAKKCMYKGFFPVFPLEILEIILMCVSSALATACGIGGGTVYSALLLGVQEFEPLEAFPISNCLIWTCGLVTYFACVLDKYQNPKNKFVNYDIAVIFGPSMLLGAKFGTIFNKIFSSSLLTVLVLFVWWYSINSTYKNVEKAKARENKMVQEQFSSELLNNSQPLFNKDNYDFDTPTQNKIELREIISTSATHEVQPTENSINSINENFAAHMMQTQIISNENEQILHEDENPIRMDRIKFMLILEAIVILDQLIEGNSKLPSFLGIARCSLIYWTVFLLYIGISLYLIKIASEQVQAHLVKKKWIIPDYKSEVMDNVQNDITKVICVAILAGIISSMVGIGGGMITNPMFSSLGMDPKESSSTSNFLIITTAIASTFLFSFAGQLNYGFAFWVSLPCTIAAFIGSFMILKYINRTKKSSIWLVIMLYFLVASMIIIVFKAIGEFKEHSVSSLLSFKNYC